MFALQISQIENGFLISSPAPTDVHGRPTGSSKTVFVRNLTDAIETLTEVWPTSEDLGN